MSSSDDERLARFCGSVGNDALLPHRSTVTFPEGGRDILILREVFASLTNGKVELPSSPSRESGVEAAFYSTRGDGIVQLPSSPSLTPGMGKRLTYLLLAGEDASIEVADAELAVFTVRARSADLLEYAVKALVFELGAKGRAWQDSFPKAPQRADLARVEAAVKGLVDPARAWALVAAVAPARWTFLEEQFETCSSCSGSGWDTHAGVCYGCSYGGRNRSGWRSSPHPPTLRDVVAFAADMEVMLRVAAAARSLVERLAPWGSPALTELEWVVAEKNHSSGSNLDVRPACMSPVFEALSEKLGDLSIPNGLSAGWFTQGQHAWKNASAKAPFRTRLDPFEPLGEIMGAGYRVQFTARSVRLSCDAPGSG